MYETSITVERIKLRAKENGISVKTMLEDCGLNKNTLSSMQSRGSWLQSNNLAKIADYLDCSVDYLLGRTDNPKITTDTYINGDNNGIQAVNNGNNSNLTVNGNTRTDTEELVEMIQGLPLVQRAKIITQIDEMKNKK